MQMHLKIWTPEGKKMTHFNGFISKKAIINSKLISSNAIIYGKSQIETNALIDPYVIIGYPVRSKTKEMISSANEIITTESAYDRVSIGSTIGKYCHIRSFTTVYEDSILENRVETGTNVIIREKCIVGSGSIIGSGTILDSKVKIGQNARIQSNNFIPPEIILGNNVFLGPGVKFANDKYPVSSKLVTTIVEDDVAIGIGAIILSGITIGKGSVIGAGTLVTKDVDEDMVMMGSPARKVMNKEEYGIKKQKYEE